MSKITPPPAMTDEQIGEIYVPWVDDRGSTHAGLMKAANTARDKQWQDMLAQQVPVAYVVEGFDGDKLYAHQLYFTLDEARKTASVFVQHYPIVNTRPLYAAPVAQQADPCPGCQRGGVCKTPECGRLKLPTNHPLRTGDHFPDAGKMMQAVPDGYKLVPVKPTPEMLGAGLRHVDGMASMPSAWAAMLAAAPAPQPTHCEHLRPMDKVCAPCKRYPNRAEQPEAPAPQPLTDARIIEVLGDAKHSTITAVRALIAEALAQQPAPAPQPLTEERLWARWEQVGMSEEETRLVVIQREPTAHEKRIANWFQVGVHAIERAHGITKGEAS